MAGAFEIVMKERKALVDKIIGMMKQGDFFHNASEWDSAALRPQNPLSKVWYRGGNRMKLMAVVSKMLSVPMDQLIIGTDDSEKAEPVKKRSKHLLYYGKMVSERIAA